MRARVLVVLACLCLVLGANISHTRSALYALARFLGDDQTVRRGGVGKRITNKLIGRSVVRRM